MKDKFIIGEYMEKFDWINSIYKYFIILDKINKQFKFLIKTMEYEEIEEHFFYLSTELLRLIPFTENKKDNSIFLNLKDGICLLKDYISFLEGDLEKILQENSKTFIKIKKIRNKYEHEPHNVNGAFSTGHSSFSAMGFYCRNELVSLDTMELTYVIYELNKLFDKIEKKINRIEFENKDELNLYIEKIKKIQIINYNKGYTRIPRQYYSYQ